METAQKLGIYLDEAGTEPGSACDTLQKLAIHYVALRFGWGDKNICDLPDKACEQIRTLLTSHNLSAVMVCSDIGDVEPSALSRVSAGAIKRTLSLVSYYKASYVRIYCGTRGNGTIDDISEWMNRITEQCILSNCVPLLEVAHDSFLTQPADIANLLHKHRRWKLLYDPVQFIIKRNINPHVKYWTLLKSFVAAIDVRDFKVNRGFKPPGVGDSHILETIQDAIATRYAGWFFMEPSLGRRCGSATTKAETLQLALDTIQPFVE